MDEGREVAVAEPFVDQPADVMLRRAQLRRQGADREALLAPELLGVQGNIEPAQQGPVRRLDGADARAPRRGPEELSVGAQEHDPAGQAHGQQADSGQRRELGGWTREELRGLHADDDQGVERRDAEQGPAQAPAGFDEVPAPAGPDDEQHVQHQARTDKILEQPEQARRGRWRGRRKAADREQGHGWRQADRRQPCVVAEQLKRECPEQPRRHHRERPDRACGQTHSVECRGTLSDRVARGPQAEQRSRQPRGRPVAADHTQRQQNEDADGGAADQQL